jgi:hypothetical protein
MLRVGSEPTILHVLDRAATVIGTHVVIRLEIISNNAVLPILYEE